ncbi:MAG: hypothetical protein ACKOED_14700 [Aestuariivirga sp.]|uniref:hypothetical protein n=1 Tax=Aestuariivirga sp. TaxID=2650926 RepID=UPI0038D05A14
MNRRLALLAAAAMALGVLAFQQYKQLLPGFDGKDGATAPAPAATAARGAKTVDLNPLQNLGSNTYASIVEQPLFNPGRLPRPPEAKPEEQLTPEPPPEPPVAPPEPPPAGPNAGDYRLLGVSAGPQGRLAVLELTASSEIVYVREGDAAGQWTVLEVGDRSVVIGSAGEAVTLTLFEYTGNEPPEQDRVLPQDEPGEPVPPDGSPVPMVPGVAPPGTDADAGGPALN